MAGWWLVRGEKQTGYTAQYIENSSPTATHFLGTKIISSGKQVLVASSLLVAGPGSSPSSVMAKVKSFGDVQRFCPKSRVFSGWYFVSLSHAPRFPPLNSPVGRLEAITHLVLKHLQETIKYPNKFPNISKHVGFNNGFFPSQPFPGFVKSQLFSL